MFLKFSCTLDFMEGIAKKTPAQPTPSVSGLSSPVDSWVQPDGRTRTVGKYLPSSKCLQSSDEIMQTYFVSKGFKNVRFVQFYVGKLSSFRKY